MSSCQTIARLLILSFGLYQMVVQTNGAPKKEKKPWQPPAGMGMTRQEFLDCNSLPKADCKEARKLMKEIARFQWKIEKKKAGGDPAGEPPQDLLDKAEAATNRFDDILYTVDELKKMRDEKEQALKGNGNSKRREKRSNWMKSATKWSLPIKFMLDADFTDADEDIIRKATQHIAAETCVTFIEEAVDATINENHLLITKDPATKCASFVGSAITGAQTLWLADRCLNAIGTPAHELLHALGLYHEHERPDRDTYVTGSGTSAKAQSTVLSHQPYDLGSLVHYGPGQGLDMQADYAELDHTIGQRAQLSYFDKRAVDAAYCVNSTGACTACSAYGGVDMGYVKHVGGNCNTCECRKGWSGATCDTPVQGSGCSPVAPGWMVVNNDNIGTIQSANPFTQGTFCHWWLKAPAGWNLKFWFEGGLQMPTSVMGGCDHFVEVNYKQSHKDLQWQGERFCSGNAPADSIDSELVDPDTNEAQLVITFDAPDFGTNPALNGFTLKYQRFNVGGGCEGQVNADETLQDLATTAGPWANVFLDLAFDSSGSVDTWEYYAENTGHNFYAAVWRPLGNNLYTLVGKNTITAQTAGARETYEVPTIERINVESGDIIGIHYDGSAPTSGGGVIPYEDAPITTQGLIDINYVASRILNWDARDNVLSVGTSVSQTASTIHRAVALVAHYCKDCTNQVNADETLQQLKTTAGPWVNVYLDLAFDSSGYIGQWEYYVDNTGHDFYAAVWRPLGSNQYQLLGKNRITAQTAGVVEKYYVPAGDRIYVETGDIIGIHYDGSAPASDGVIPYEDAPISTQALVDINYVASRILNWDARDANLPIGTIVTPSISAIQRGIALVAHFCQ